MDKDDEGRRQDGMPYKKGNTRDDGSYAVGRNRPVPPRSVARSYFPHAHFTFRSKPFRARSPRARIGPAAGPSIRTELERWEKAGAKNFLQIVAAWTSEMVNFSCSSFELVPAGRGSEMPLPLTHAMVPIAGAIAFSRRPIPWWLILVAGIAAMAPDSDSQLHPFTGHRRQLDLFSPRDGHSLFMALALGALAAAFHRFLRVRYLTAAIVIAGAAASHGLLDMMTDSGRPVAYLWPLSSTSLFADRSMLSRSIAITSSR